MSALIEQMMFVLIEGCSEIISCMDGVQMTQDGSIVIDKISASENMASSSSKPYKTQLCTKK